MTTLASPVDLLMAAADKIQFEGWTRRVPARTALGRECEPRNPKAVAWCIAGALAALGEPECLLVASAWGLLTAHLGFCPTEFNDLAENASEVADALRCCAKKASQ